MQWPAQASTLMRFLLLPVLRRTMREQPSAWITLAVGLPVLAMCWPALDGLHFPWPAAPVLLVAGLLLSLGQAFRKPAPAARLKDFMHQAGSADYRRDGQLNLILLAGRFPLCLLIWLAICPQVWFFSDTVWARVAYVVLGALSFYFAASISLSKHQPPFPVSARTVGLRQSRQPALRAPSVWRIQLRIYLKSYLLNGNGLAACLAGLAVLGFGAWQMVNPSVAKPAAEYRLGLFDAWVLLVFGLFHALLTSASQVINTKWYDQAGLGSWAISRELIFQHLRLTAPVLLMAGAVAPLFLSGSGSAAGDWLTITQALASLLADWAALALIIWLLGFYPPWNNPFLGNVLLFALLLSALISAFAAPLLWVALSGMAAGLLVWRQKRIAA